MFIHVVHLQEVYWVFFGPVKDYIYVLDLVVDPFRLFVNRN
jgi:hypothetical protein